MNFEGLNLRFNNSFLLELLRDKMLSTLGDRALVSEAAPDIEKASLKNRTTWVVVSF